MTPLRRITLFALLLAAAAGIGYAAFQLTVAPAPSLTSYAPSGALLTIESPDFSSLLHAWNHSAEQQRWLKSSDYESFSRSRLFDRLSDAQQQFATVAGLPPDTQFLQAVAGSQSLFAWYDIGKLQFLYITRMPPGGAEHTPLLALRDKFQQRQAGGVTFYVRSSADAASGDTSDASSDTGAASTDEHTVAFAVRGEYLLLATREDLLASALEQMAHPSAHTLASDPWYAEAVAEAKEKPGDLRLVLNLKSVTHSPYFQSYWVQRNITEMRRYKASVSDLYRGDGVFREERFLLKAQDTQSTQDVDLSPVMHFLPVGVVYRAVAAPTTAQVLAELNDKLLKRGAANIEDTHIAPVAAQSVPMAGDANDFDNRIDAPEAQFSQPDATTLQPLLDHDTPVAMLSLSSAAALGERKQGLFQTVQTGVVLSMNKPCDAEAWKHALTTTLAPRISANEESLHWSAQSKDSAQWFHLDGPLPLAFAAQGNNCLIASDDASLLAMLSAPSGSHPEAVTASVAAGFSHEAQKTPLRKLLARLDGSNGSGGQPSFFSGNMVSLSKTFSTLQNETFTESQSSPTLTRQTVTYVWRKP